MKKSEINIVENKIKQLKRRLKIAKKENEFAECLILDGGIFYLEYMLMELYN